MLFSRPEAFFVWLLGFVQGYWILLSWMEGFEPGFCRVIPIKAGNLDGSQIWLDFCQNENSISDLGPSLGKTWGQGQLCSIFSVKLGSQGPGYPRQGPPHRDTITATQVVGRSLDMSGAPKPFSGGINPMAPLD